MSGPDQPTDDAIDEHVEAKAKEIRLVGPRRPATKINRKFLVLSLGSTGVIVAIFFGARLASAAAHQQQLRNPAESAPVAPPPSVKAPTYRDTVIAQTDGGPSVAMPCSQYPGYANCTPDADLPASAQPGSATGQTGSPQVNAALQRQQAAEQESYQAAHAARSAAVFFPGANPGGGAATPVFAAAAPVAGTPPLIPASDSGSTPSANVLDGSGQDEKRAFAGQAQAEDYIRGRLEAPRSPYEVKAGTTIAAALVTALTSDLPGEIVAQVTQPVYDHVTGRYLLIPQGARLIGRYDSQVAFGQNRALIAWSRIVFPNGYSINIGAMEGADRSGASGLTDRVNHHWGTVAAGVAVSSILAIGTAVATEAAGNDGRGVTIINTGAATAATDASRVGDRIVDKALDRQPTIQVRAGFPLRVLVSKDIILEPYR
jgi:type IV secretion system protein VirB10